MTDTAVADRITLLDAQDEIRRKLDLAAQMKARAAAQASSPPFTPVSPTPPPYTPAPVQPVMPSGTLKQAFQGAYLPPFTPAPLPQPTGGGLLGKVQSGLGGLGSAVRDIGSFQMPERLTPGPLSTTLNDIVGYRGQQLKAAFGGMAPPGTEQQGFGTRLKQALLGPGTSQESQEWQQSFERNPEWYQMAEPGITMAPLYSAPIVDLANQALMYGPQFAGSLPIKAAVEASRAGARAGAQGASSYMEKQSTFGLPDQQLMSRAETAAAKAGEEAPKAAAQLAPEQTEAVGVFTEALKASKASDPAFATALKEKRLAMDARIKAIRATPGLSPGEMSRQIDAVRTGAISASFKLPQEFTPAHLDALGKIIYQSDLRSQESRNAYGALMDLANGVRVQPARAKLLGKVFGPDFESAIPTTTKEWSVLKEVLDDLGIPRIVKSSFDISWPLRQGIMMVSRPQFYSGMKDMIKVVTRDLDGATADAMYRDILNSPRYSNGEGLLGKLAIADPSGMGTIERTAEGFATHGGGKLARWVERLPGIKQSQLAYATAGNQVRWKVANSIIDGWDNIGAQYGQREADALANWVNISTGWGRIGPLEKVLPELANALYAPRFWASCLERIPYGMYLIAKEPLLRGEVMRDFATFAAMNVALLSGLKLSGVADVELDPRSTEFGRAHIGPQHIDLLGGLQPAIRQAAQIMSGRGKSGATGEFYSLSRGETILRAIQGKLSPQAGFLVDVLTGKTFTGEEITANPESVKAQAWNRLAPMAIADLVDAVRASGPTGFIYGALSGLGGSVLTYQTPFDKQRALRDTIAKEQGFKDFNDMANGKFVGIGTPRANAIINADPRMVAVQAEIEQYKGSRGSTMQRGMADIRVPFETEQHNDDTAVNAGTMDRAKWLAQYKDRQKTLSARYAEYLAEHPDVADQMAKTAKNLDPFTLPTDATPDMVRAAYFKLFDQYKGETGQITDEEWNKLGPDIDRFRAGLTPTQATALDENLAAGKSDLVKEYRQDAAILQPYWDMRDSLWQQFASGNSTLQPFASMSFDEFLSGLGQQYVSEGKSADMANTNGYVKAFNKFLDGHTQQFIRQNPEVDALRNIWGYTSGVHTQQAAQIYQARMGVMPRLIRP